MKQTIKQLFFVFAAILTLGGCSNADLDELREDQSKLAERVSALEKWTKTANDQISSLQQLITAIDGRDYVTGVTPVMEAGKEVGYTITFSKASPVTIKNGTNGLDGQTPIMGVKLHTDGKYYWTIQLGTAEATWLKDEKGNMIPTTGKDGSGSSSAIAPQIRINTTNNTWEISTDGGKTWVSTGVKATGDKGDKGDTGDTGSSGSGGTGNSIFRSVDNSKPDYVEFTLTNGTKFQLRRYTALRIGTDNSNELLLITDEKTIPLSIPTGFKESDYTSIIAEIEDNQGLVDTDIKTRSVASSPAWKVEVTKPTAINGVCQDDAKVTVTPTVAALGETAVLKVKLVDSKGNEITSTRAIKFTGTVVAAGALSTLSSPGTVKYLAVTGDMSADNFTFIRTNFSTLEGLDLSGTTLTGIPENALNFTVQNQPDIANRTIKRIILPQTVTTIYDSAFAMCAALESINLPQNVTTLGQSMFDGCANLEEVQIPALVTTIPNSAFNASGLKSITIPNTVTTIGNSAFQKCSTLKSITIPATVTTLGTKAFMECSQLETAVIHAPVTSLEKTFERCTNLRQVTLPDELRIIGESTFYRCEALEYISLNSQITEIESWAFSGCKKLREITLPDQLETLGSVAFKECHSLKTIKIPNKVKKIPEQCFLLCHNLSSVELPSNLEIIGVDAFTYSISLKTIEIPASVTQIEAVAFSKCYNLTLIRLLATTPPRIHSYTFTNMNLDNNHGIILKVSDVAAYSAWNTYFPDGIEALD